MTSETLYDDKAYDEKMKQVMDDGDGISEWTEVADSFDQMGLNENLLRGIYGYGASEQETNDKQKEEDAKGETKKGGNRGNERGPREKKRDGRCRESHATSRVGNKKLTRLPVPTRRFRKTVRHPTERDRPLHQRTGRHPTSPIWNRKNRHLLRWNPAELGHRAARVPGARAGPHTRARPADRKGHACLG